MDDDKLIEAMLGAVKRAHADFTFGDPNFTFEESYAEDYQRQMSKQWRIYLTAALAVVRQAEGYMLIGPIDPETWAGLKAAAGGGYTSTIAAPETMTGLAQSPIARLTVGAIADLKRWGIAEGAGATSAASSPLTAAPADD